MKEARWWKKVEDAVQCELCPHRCKIAHNRFGLCSVRQNIDGKLYALAYGHPVAIHVDPIEKKPLYHYFPGSKILSIGTIGCNLFCEFCQNWDIARATADNVKNRLVEPEDIIESARSSGLLGIAFTYNEPTVFGEYVLDIARLAHNAGLKTVMVSNGYITPEAIGDIYPFIDAANIDLKAFSQEFYRRYCKGDLQSVLDALLEIKRHGTFLELTTLIIPGLNDNATEIEKMIDWIVKNLGVDIPLHFSAFHPSFKMMQRKRTSKTDLDCARKIAINSGLRYIYEGNVATFEENNTFCYSCGQLLIERRGYTIVQKKLQSSVCSCGAKIAVVQ
ncbi:MAG: AmmeMemoRadiSam system radical SAM enzyme [Candidatus Marinimicrobia bacterium]|nr:AmmeMemoRadiSam system radical SAM enzyme [Candidatus Neomarinimicrobiota bacterium]